MQNKKILIGLFISGILLFNACEQKSPITFTEEDEASIRETVTKAMQIMKETDDMVAYTELYYAEDAIVLAPNTDPVMGRDYIIELFSVYPDFEMENKIIDLYGAKDMAYVYGFYTLDFIDEIPGDSGKYIEIWRKQEDGSWKITHDIFNTSLPMPVLMEDDHEDSDGD